MIIQITQSVTAAINAEQNAITQQLITPNKASKMFQIKANDLIAVWFSCGAASAVAAKRTIEKYGNNCEVRVINTPIKEEDNDNRRFLRDIERWIGVKIELSSNPEFPDNSARSVWAKRKYMSGVKGAPCTSVLKKEARYMWEKVNKPTFHVLGFTYDETDRHDLFVKTERENVLPVLIEEKLTKADCFALIKEAGIELPEVYKKGYPNANCIGCVKATSPTYWNHVRLMHPLVFADRAAQSRIIKCRLVRVKGKRIFLDELKVTDKGRPIKNMNFECGIFCEETKWLKNIKNQPH